jgi:hypothetical protein
MNQDQQLQKGDRVSFDLEGHVRKPFGFGVVVRTDNNGRHMIQPDLPLLVGARMINIKKVGSK